MQLSYTCGLKHLPAVILQHTHLAVPRLQEVAVHHPYRCSCGWILFAAGFVMPFLWVVSGVGWLGCTGARLT